MKTTSEIWHLANWLWHSMISRLIASSLILCSLCSAYSPAQTAAVKRAKEKSRLLLVGDAAPEWELPDPRGATHSLSKYRGKVVVLDFWATWCGPCVGVMSQMEKLHQKYGQHSLVILGVNSWETGDPVAFIKKRRYTYTSLLKGETVADAYGVTILPSVCVIGADGRIIYFHEGTHHKNLAGLIKTHLDNVSREAGAGAAGSTSVPKTSSSVK